MTHTIDNFLKEFEFNGDGTGFFDSYEKKEQWLTKTVGIHLIQRKITEDTFLCLKKLFDNQNHYDSEWKSFIAIHLLDDLKSEWENEELTIDMIINELEIVDISFGYYDAPYDFNINLISKNVSAEHGIILLCDKSGNSLKTYIE